MIRGLSHVWIGLLLTSVVLAQPALMEPPEFPSTPPGPEAVHPGTDCFWLAGGSIGPDDVDSIRVIVPFANNRTIVDVDFSDDDFPNSSGNLRVSLVDELISFSNIDDGNSEPDSVCGLHGQSIPMGSPKDSVVDLGVRPGPTVIDIEITGQGLPFGTHSQTFDYDVWVFAVDESLACLADEDCDDGIDCTLDGCEQGICVHEPDDASCDNSIFCDGAERCDVDLGCTSGAPPCPPEFCDEDTDSCTGVSAVFDIRPGACPNVFNPSSRGVLPVALLGTDTVGTPGFDVGGVDVDSIRLARADGVGGSAAPAAGPPGPHAVITPANAPFGESGCDCAAVGDITGPHLLLKFDAQALASELELDALPSGSTVELVISGVLTDGTPFRGPDCLHLVPATGRSQPVCGNGVVETGEQCDPPDGISCDESCRIIPGDGPANDSFLNPLTVSDGTIPYNNVGAGTDGPDEPDMCDFFNDTHIESDVWFCYTSTCRGEVVVSLCGSQYDTKLAVYEGCGPPNDLPIACNDVGCSVNTRHSRVTFDTQPRRPYLIRVGGFLGAQGAGLLTIRCNEEPCGRNAGECMAANGTPGCADEQCCRDTCELDRFCCDVAWDDLCVALAEGVCTEGFPACRADAGDCSVAGATPGCDDLDCCNSVCRLDLQCCLQEWDQLCVDRAAGECGLNCGGDSGDCFAANGSPGCSDESCCRTVCREDAFCCATDWDVLCAGRADELCP